MAEPAADLSTSAIASGTRELGYRLANALEETSTSGNVVFSPVSLAIAFAMVREGATGASAEQIDTVFGLPGDRSQEFNALLASLRDSGPHSELSIGNAIFSAKGYPVRQQFLQSLQKWYGAGVYETTFPQPATDAVNDYVAKQTHNLIPKLITDEIPAETVLALINTLYLKAAWQYPFSERETRDADFTSASGEVVQAKMMSLSAGGIGYTEGPGWQIVRLPYRESGLDMLVLVPSTATGAPTPAALLSPTYLQRASNQMPPAEVQLHLPRWSFGTTMPLTDLLKRMGLHAPFESGGLRGITSDPSLEVSSVFQQALISVREKGTVAAAATGMMMGGSAQKPVDVKRITADHPFAYAIVDRTTGVPVFEGTVGDPTAS